MMQKSVIGILFIFLVVFSCNKKESNNVQTLNKGKVDILVDESLLPIIQDQQQVFESQYDAKLNLIAKSETEIVQLLSQNKYQLAILTKELSNSESAYFQSKKIKPRINPFATDAVAFISNKTNKDTLVDLKVVSDFMKGDILTKYKGFVFDNSNSSTVRYLKELAKITTLPSKNIFSFKTNNEVIQFVEKNEGMVGVVGVNWLSQPSTDMQVVVDNVKVLSVKSVKNNKYYKPSQDNMAGGLYPLTREIKLINYQAKPGLGMGFAKFLRNDIGQRIILKSGLVPVIMPNRNIKIRKEVNK
jgi:phosphate transport system substrate-binding protein